MKLTSAFFTLALFWMMSPMISMAQYNGYQAVGNVGAFKEKYRTEAAKIQSISSRFIQEKTLIALTEKISSEGNFNFMRNNKVRIEYVKPFSYLMVMNGDKMKVKDSKKESTIQLNSNKLFQQINKIMIDCVQGTLLDSKDFTSRVFENEKTYLIELKPVSSSLKAFYSNILLTVEKMDFSAKSITMEEPEGDKTVITFINKKLNENLSDALFNL